MERKRVIVIGGANTDICGAPAGVLIQRDSNPGSVTLRHGGVGRNVAHDLKLLGLDVSFLTAIGGDVFAAGLLESCKALGLDMSMTLSVPGARSSVYLYVTDEKGDMNVGIADMDITALITPAVIEQHLETINGFDAVVIEGNLSEETLTYIAEHVTAPLYADPVSTVKALRLREALGKLTAFKPNLLEAQYLTGKTEAEECAAALLATGIRRVFLSLGSRGMLAADAMGIRYQPSLPANVVNTTGAGDAAMAAIVWAGVHELSLAEAAKAAAVAGALTCESLETNSPELSAEKLLQA